MATAFTRSTTSSRAWRACLGIVLAWAATAGMALAATPALPALNAALTLDGTPLGSAIANRSAAATLSYDPSTQLYHLWTAVVDESGAGDTAADFYPLRIAGYRHATSTDGTAFTTTGTLSFAGSPFASEVYGSDFGEPAWLYPKAAQWNGNTILAMWTMNAFFAPPGFGDYNYNISINNVGTNPSNLALTHEGPVGAVPADGIAGQTAGIYGIVNGVMYYDNNSLLGRAALTDNGTQTFPAVAATGPWQVTGSNTAVADLLTPLGYTACQFTGGNSYVHNDARVLDNGDGTLGFFYTVRNCDGTRKAQQIYYMESADNGATWSTPVGIVTGPVVIGANGPSAGFSLTDVIVARGVRTVYFNYVDTNGNLVVGASPPPAPAPPTTASVPVPLGGGLWNVAMLLALALAAALALRRRALKR